MSNLWLPVNKFTVEYQGKTQVVIIPRTGDKSYDEYLEEAEREKTLNELKKPLAHTQERKVPLKDVQGALKEFIEWRNKKKRQ